ncbi:hypothetical protein ACOT81_35995 [Streptomyces sp. WI04-05B]|uniref:hypothetical protein n=1 Tax=Streptomyces TaxID=1883 RepID=UPI0029A27D49|nr:MULTISPECIES: hypothetical protein [unclassified Streptomyces]MDX2548594.1 hypothetical protein [Streptomyces sp. WI04-05B]MDX2588082.1 hypothetical protein [Streptomyces sp. WI04-05A]
MYGKCTRYRVKGIPAVKDRSFDALQDAKTWLAQARTDARRGEFVDPRDGAISLKDYIATHWWPTQSGDPSTLERIEQRVRRHIVPHLGALPLYSVGTGADKAVLRAPQGPQGPRRAPALKRRQGHTTAHGGLRTRAGHHGVGRSAPGRGRTTSW